MSTPNTTAINANPVCIPNDAAPDELVEAEAEGEAPGTCVLMAEADPPAFKADAEAVLVL
jgi:hypothetical protein